MALNLMKIGEWKAHDTQIRTLALGHKSGRVLATTANDNTINLWAIGQSQCIISIDQIDTPINALRFGHADELLLSGHLNGAVNVWDLQPIQAIRTFDTCKDPIRSLDMSSTGLVLASGSSTGTINIYDMRSASCILELKHYDKPLNCIRFSPDNKWLATASDDSSIKIWDIGTRRILCELRDHNTAVDKIEFHPAHLIMASTSRDRTIKIWDVEKFDLVTSSIPDTAPFSSILYDYSGDLLYGAQASALKTFKTEPVISIVDAVKTDWRNVVEMAIAQHQLIIASFSGKIVSTYGMDLRPPLNNNSAKLMISNNPNLSGSYLKLNGFRPSHHHPISNHVHLDVTTANKHLQSNRHSSYGHYNADNSRLPPIHSSPPSANMLYPSLKRVNANAAKINRLNQINTATSSTNALKGSTNTIPQPLCNGSAGGSPLNSAEKKRQLLKYRRSMSHLQVLTQQENELTSPLGANSSILNLSKLASASPYNLRGNSALLAALNRTLPISGEETFSAIKHNNDAVSTSNIIDEDDSDLNEKIRRLSNIVKKGNAVLSTAHAERSPYLSHSRTNLNGLSNSIYLGGNHLSSDLPHLAASTFVLNKMGLNNNNGPRVGLRRGLGLVTGAGGRLLSNSISTYNLSYGATSRSNVVKNAGPEDDTISIKPSQNGIPLVNGKLANSLSNTSSPTKSLTAAPIVPPKLTGNTRERISYISGDKRRHHSFKDVLRSKPRGSKSTVITTGANLPTAANSTTLNNTLANATNISANRTEQLFVKKPHYTSTKHFSTLSSSTKLPGPPQPAKRHDGLNLLRKSEYIPSANVLTAQHTTAQSTTLQTAPNQNIPANSQGATEFIAEELLEKLANRVDPRVKEVVFRPRKTAMPRTPPPEPVNSDSENKCDVDDAPKPDLVLPLHDTLCSENQAFNYPKMNDSLSSVTHHFLGQNTLPAATSSISSSLGYICNNSKTAYNIVGFSTTLTTTKPVVMIRPSNTAYFTESNIYNNNTNIINNNNNNYDYNRNMNNNSNNTTNLSAIANNPIAQFHGPTSTEDLNLHRHNNDGQKGCKEQQQQNGPQPLRFNSLDDEYDEEYINDGHGIQQQREEQSRGCRPNPGSPTMLSCSDSPLSDAISSSTSYPNLASIHQQQSMTGRIGENVVRDYNDDTTNISRNHDSSSSTARHNIYNAPHVEHHVNLRDRTRNKPALQPRPTNLTFGHQSAVQHHNNTIAPPELESPFALRRRNLLLAAQETNQKVSSRASNLDNNYMKKNANNTYNTQRHHSSVVTFSGPHDRPSSSFLSPNGSETSPEDFYEDEFVDMRLLVDSSTYPRANATSNVNNNSNKAHLSTINNRGIKTLQGTNNNNNNKQAMSQNNNSTNVKRNNSMLASNNRGAARNYSESSTLSASHVNNHGTKTQPHISASFSQNALYAAQSASTNGSNRLGKMANHHNMPKTAAVEALNANPIENMTSSHLQICDILANRVRHVRMAKNLCRNNADLKTAIATIIEMNEESVLVDTLSLYVQRPHLWTLDVSLLLLPHLVAMLNHNFETYITLSCKALKLILKNFGPLIKASINKTPIIGVDFSREERLKKCGACYKQLLSIKSHFDQSISYGGKLGKEIKDVQILLQTFE